ncbi:hypothetical protein ACHAXA_004349 [Cyclostephanos tholiformis]|uniref:FAD-binding domain-containing protein n=1 Tax=Cyclostephanos tholiformis TaxID=382380 RepID=A0ABD3SPR2_9STRA
MTRRTIIALANRLGGWKMTTSGGPTPRPTPSSSSSPSIDAPTRRRRPTGGLVDPRGLASSSSSSPPSNREHYDVIIAGGGAVGSTLARMLLDDENGHAATTTSSYSTKRRHRRRRPLRVALLERRSAPPSLRDLVDGCGTISSATTPGPRAYALSPASLSYLGRGALRALLRSDRCGVYDAMQIWEHDGPAQLHFTGDDLVNAIEDGRLVDLEVLLGDYHDDEEGGEVTGATTTMATTTEEKKMREKMDRSSGVSKHPWLGAVIEDSPLVSSLWDELKNDDRIDLLDELQITSIRAPSTGDMGKAVPPPPVLLSYTRANREGGGGNTMDTTISCDLLVAADGANSQVRSLIGNFPMMTHTYGKKAVTCTVELETGMARTAYQRFLSHGPIALLPVWNRDDVGGGTSSRDGPDYANVVWSTTLSEANHLLSLSPSDFTSALNRHLRQGPNVNPSLLPELIRNNTHSSPFYAVAAELDSLLRTANDALTMGTWTESPTRNHFRMPPRSVRVVGPVMAFDLTTSHVVMRSTGGPGGTYSGGYASPRVALVGDAAHTLHPMAGQGLNLGMSDVASLSNLIKEAVDSGMDVGGTSLFLDRYNRERMVGGWGIVGGVHGLHEIFAMSGNVPTSVKDESYHGARDSAGTLQSLIGYGRSLGMNVVNGLPLVRRTLAEIAAGATHHTGGAGARWDTKLR